MSSRKKRRYHHCANHRTVIARGKCSQCGKWLCKHCYTLIQGKFYCTRTCLPRKEPSESDEQKPANTDSPHPGPGTPHRALSWILPSLLSILTIGCVVLLAIMYVRTNRLSRKIHTLESNRAVLIDHLHTAKNLIQDLRKRIEDLSDSVKCGEESNARERMRPMSVRRPHTPPAATTEYGVPWTFHQGSRGEKMVALTFDGGSHANAAYDICDTLTSRKVRSTMFLTGHFIRRYPDVTRTIVARGHEVGNHTFSHPHLTSYARNRVHRTLPSVSADMLTRELMKADSIFRLVTNGAGFSPVWRAPYGEMNRDICSWAQHAGYLHIGWGQGRSWRQNLDSNDWVPDEETPGYHSPSEVLEKITALAHSSPHGINGGIILMHLGSERKERHDRVHRVLGTIIDTLHAMHYSFVTISELLAQSSVNLSRLPPISRDTVKQTVSGPQNLSFD